MKKIILLLILFCFLSVYSFSQTTEAFEDETTGSASFIDNGQIFNITNYRGWLLWGGGIGLAIALISFVSNYLNNKSFQPSITFSIALLNVLVIAPIFEEFLLRGAVLGNLRQQYSFWQANFLSSLMFVVLHLPGWYFAGSLVENITKLVGGAAAIFGVSLLFGYAVKRSDSVIAGMLAHFLNNLH